MTPSDREYLEARISDAVRVSQKRDVPKFVGFLDESGAALAVKVMTRENVKWHLFGGYNEAERVYFGVFPEWCEPENSLFPVTKLRIKNKGSRILEHRDILGALMSAGIERDTVGDILTGEDYAVVFVCDTVAEHIINEVVKIASCGVEISIDEDVALPQFGGFVEKTDTVASLRLDGIVSALAGVSRNTASEYISSGLVSVGGLLVQKPTKVISSGDVITVRKKGKFVIDSTEDRTKKDRIILKYRKYI